MKSWVLERVGSQQFDHACQCPVYIEKNNLGEAEPIKNDIHAQAMRKLHSVTLDARLEAKGKEGYRKLPGWQLSSQYQTTTKDIRGALDKVENNFGQWSIAALQERAKSEDLIYQRRYVRCALLNSMIIQLEKSRAQKGQQPSYEFEWINEMKKYKATWC